MVNRKAHNSILFLTTLSVYFGLALVGGSPSVFAQAALTPRFELVDEFDVEDDLDNKPDDEQNVGDYLEVCERLFRIASEFAGNHPEARVDGTYAFGYSVRDDRKSGRLIKWSGRQEVPLFAPAFGSHANSFRTFGDQNLSDRRGDILDLAVSPFGLTLTAELCGRDAAVFPEALTRKASQVFDTRNARAVIYQKSFILSENNRIFVVTRLPRASIDELVAEK